MIKTSIFLHVHNNEAQQFLDPAGAPVASADLHFSTEVENSHPGSWNGVTYTVPHDANLTISGLVASLIYGYEPPTPVRLMMLVNDAQVWFRSRANDINAIVSVKKGDRIKIIWQTVEAVSLSGNPVQTQLVIKE